MPVLFGCYECEESQFKSILKAEFPPSIIFYLISCLRALIVYHAVDYFNLLPVIPVAWKSI